MTASVSPGYDPDYLINQVASGRENYYLKAIEVQGEPAGTWFGAGAEYLGLSGEVDPEMLKALYTHLTDPRSLEELQSVTKDRVKEWRKDHPGVKASSKEYKDAKAEIIAQTRAEFRLGSALRDYSVSTEANVEKALAKLPADATPEQRKAAELKVRQTAPKPRTYYDVTFSASKSVSLLHAGFQAQAVQLRAAGDEVGAVAAEKKAELVWDAMSTGTQAGLNYLSREAGYAREGRFANKPKSEGGITVGRRVEAPDLTIAQFRQHLSRDEDPQMHIHNMILNRVRVTSIDPVTGQEREKWLAIDGEGIYRHSLAAGFIQERVTSEKLIRDLEVAFEWRPDGKALEVLGISEQVRDHFSKRRRTVLKGIADLAADYETAYGKSPSPHVLAKMAQFVVLDKRAGKKEAVSRDDLLSRWESEVITDTRESLSAIPDSVAAAAAEQGVSDLLFNPQEVIAQAVEQIQSERSTFHKGHIMAAVAKALPPSLGGLEAHQIENLLEDLSNQAIEHGVGEAKLVRLDPPAPVKVPAELTRSDGQSIYTRHAGQTYATEVQLSREDQLRQMAKDLGGRVLNPKLVEQCIATAGLNELQAEAVRGITGAGRRADVLVGPAGAGKSRTVGALATAWEKDGGQVFGIANSEAATNVLRKEGLKNAANMAEFLTYNRLAEQGVRGEKVDFYVPRPGQLIVVDEASMSSTNDLHEIRRIVQRAGADLLFTGDWAQTTSVGAGGMFKALADELPHAYELEEVMRFNAEWERDASLRLRAGDTSVLAEYEAHGRLHHGTWEEMLNASYQDWLADHMQGLDSVLITSTNETAFELATRAQQDLIRLGQVDGSGISAPINGAMEAFPGDRVQLRHIDRDLVSEGGGRFASNRDTAYVETIHDDGSLTVRYEDGDHLTLPTTYVQKYVELAYAGTVNAVQGRTVAIGREIDEPSTSREGMYTGMSRGFAENHYYTPTSADKPDHIAVIGETLGRVSAEAAASVVLRELYEENGRLDRWYPELEDLMTREAEVRYGRVLFGEAGPAIYERATAESDGKRWNSVLRLARQVDAAGLDAEQMLRDAVTAPRGFDDARTISGVIHDRLKIAFKDAERAQIRADEQTVRTVERTHERALVEAISTVQTTSVSPASVDISLDTQSVAEAAWQAGQLQQAPVLGLDWNAVQDAQAAQAAALATQWVDPMATAADEAEARERAAAVEAHMDRWMAMQQVPSLHYGQGEQARSELADQRAAEAEERAGWDYRLRHIEGPEGEYARELADEVMVPREQALGQELAQVEELPEWAVGLGPVPDNAMKRAEWIERAGAVAAYREAHSYTNQRDAIGAAPAAGAVDVRLDWLRAWRALGEPDERMEMVGATDRQLQQWVERYQRELTWAPAYVADQMGQSYLDRQDMLREASQAKVAAAELTATDPVQAAVFLQRAEELEARISAAEERNGKLETVHDARNAWHDHTLQTRERSQEAQAELDRRYGARDELDLVDVDQDQAVEPEPVVQPEAEPVAADLDVAPSHFGSHEWEMEEPEPDWEIAAPAAQTPEVAVEPEPVPEVSHPVEMEEPEPDWEIAPPAVQAPEAAVEPVEPEPVVQPEPEVSHPVERSTEPVEMVEGEYDWGMEEPEAAEHDEAVREVPAAEPERAPAAEVQRDLSTEMLQQQLLEEEMKAWSERQAQQQRDAPEQDQAPVDSRQQRQDQELAQGREEIREMQQRRTQASEPLVGEALDQAVEVAHSAKDTLAARAAEAQADMELGRVEQAPEIVRDTGMAREMER